MQKKNKTTTKLKALREDELYVIRGGRNGNNTSRVTKLISDISNWLFRN